MCCSRVAHGKEASSLPPACKVTSSEYGKYLRRRICAPQPLTIQMKKILSPSARSALSKRVLRLTTDFVPTSSNSNPSNHPLAATNI